MSKPELIIIAAIAVQNRGIGYNGTIPWHLPEDLKRFARLTKGHTVIMGRKTWEFDLKKNPLRDRHNIVLSHTANPPNNSSLNSSSPTTNPPNSVQSLTFAKSLPEALSLAQAAQKIYIIGGASLYQQTLSCVKTLELTLVQGTYDADTFFPPYHHLIPQTFRLVYQEVYPSHRYQTYIKADFHHP